MGGLLNGFIGVTGDGKKTTINPTVVHKPQIILAWKMLFSDLGHFGAEPTDSTRRSDSRIDVSPTTYFQKVGISIKSSF